MPLSSLPSSQGVGDFYESAYEFIDLLKKAKIKIWQLLPLNPVGYGSSPYQSECGEAIDPCYISLKWLKEHGYIKNYEPFNKDSKLVDFYHARLDKEKYLKEAFLNTKDTTSKEFKDFLKKNKWCSNYAKFKVLFEKNKYLDWDKWTKKEKYSAYDYTKFDFKPYEKEILFIEWCQFIASIQFKEMKEYANKNGVLLMGDIPFYVGFNSSDCWSNQDEFLLDEFDHPTLVAGVPPDYFSKDGQRWGNPIYDWKYMEQDGFTFWINRIKNALNTFDILRIDHFRAFDTYYTIKESEKTARNGEWKEAPGSVLFSILEKEGMTKNIIAEDLGDLVPSVLALRDKFNLKGMNVFEFNVFNREFVTTPNQVIYTGTHDNDTVMGWYESLSEENKELFDIILRFAKIEGKDTLDKILRYVLKSKCEYAIIPVQDYLGLPSEYRINTPGSFGSPNWEFRLLSLDEFAKKTDYIASLIEESNR